MEKAKYDSLQTYVIENETAAVGSVKIASPNKNCHGILQISPAWT